MTLILVTVDHLDFLLHGKAPLKELGAYRVVVSPFWIDKYLQVSRL